MSTMKFNKTVVASMVTVALLSACNDDSIEPAAVSVTPPSVDVVVEQPTTDVVVEVINEDVAESATISGSVISATSRKALVGITVNVTVNGVVTPLTTDVDGQYVINDLPLGQDVMFSFVDSTGFLATSYGMLNTDDMQSGVVAPTVELFQAAQSTVAVTSVMGEAITGATLYISGANLGTGAPDVVGVESAADSGTYTFAGLPMSGADYDVLTKTKMMTASGDVVEVVGSASVSIMSFGTSSSASTVVEDVEAGDDLIAYVDSVATPTMFDIVFSITGMQGDTLANGPDKIEVIVDGGAIWATHDGMGGYAVSLTAAQALSQVTVAPFDVDGDMYTLADATVSNGLSSFSGGEITVSSSAAMVNENAEMPTEITHQVLSNGFVVGESATVVIGFDQPVELANIQEVTYDYKGLKNSTSSVYATAKRGWYKNGRMEAETRNCFNINFQGNKVPCSYDFLYSSTPDNNRDETGFTYQTDAQKAAGSMALNAAKSSFDDAEDALDSAELAAGYDAAAANDNFTNASTNLASAETAYTEAQTTALTATVAALEATYDADLATADSIVTAATTTNTAATTALADANTVLTAAQLAFNTLDNTATIEEISAANVVVEDAQGVVDDADDALTVVSVELTAATTAQSAAALLATKDTATLQAEADTALATAFDNVKTAVLTFESAERDDVYVASNTLNAAEVAVSDAETAMYSVLEVNPHDINNYSDLIYWHKTGMMHLKSANNKSSNTISAESISFNADKTVMTITLDHENILQAEDEAAFQALSFGENFTFNFVVKSSASEGLFEAKEIELSSRNVMSTKAIDNLIVASASGKDIQGFNDYIDEGWVGFNPSDRIDVTASQNPDNWVTVPGREYTDGDGVVHALEAPIIKPTYLGEYCTSEACTDVMANHYYNATNYQNGTNTVTLVSPYQLTGSFEVTTVSYADKGLDENDAQVIVEDETVSTIYNIADLNEEFVFVNDLLVETILPLPSNTSKDAVTPFYGVEKVITGFDPTVVKSGSYYVYKFNPHGGTNLDGHYTKVNVSYNLETTDGEMIKGEKSYTIK